MVSEDDDARTTGGSGTDNPADADPSGFQPMEARTWHWQFSDDADVVVDIVAPWFESQRSAEDWLTRHVDALRDQEIAAVTLFDGEGVVYGPMDLGPE